MKDPQRHRVYSWEAAWSDWNRGTLSLAGAREVVRWACHKYGIPSPRVTQHKDRQFSYSKGAPENVISFRLDQRNPAVALHEAAHHISGVLFGERTTMADHAPEWLGIYLWLLEGYRVAPRTALHASAKAAGLRWVPTWTMSPKRLQRRRRA